MNKKTALAIAIGALLLIGLIGATIVTAKNPTVYAKTPPGATSKLRAAFSANPTSGEGPLNVQFTDLSTGTGITDWSWSFGDGSTSSLQHPSHAYMAAGSYTVKLTVRNTAGRSASVEKTNAIAVTAPVTQLVADFVAVAAYSANPTSGDAPLVVTFTDESTGNPTAWAWDFNNDGTVDSTERNPLYTYNSAGSYTVKLTVKNDGGSVSEVKINYITVNPAPVAPAAAFSSDVQTGTVPLTVKFTDASTGAGPLTHAWDFNYDGVTDSTLQNASYTYSTAGTYTVKLTVANTAGSDNEIKNGYITVTASGSPDVLDQTETTAKVDTAYTAGYGRLASMQAAYRAWVIPSRPDLVAIATNVKSNSISTPLKGDGVTDDTAALQALINELPAETTVYFPPSTYRINGPITITKPLTMVGAPGTVFDCSRATQNVFTLQGASSTSRINGVTVTGIVVEGPGIETYPKMFTGQYLQNVQFSYVKFHNVGTRAINVKDCLDVLVDHSVFDNVFYTGDGYGVGILGTCDRITVRDNFFVTKGRHGVATGSGTRSVTVENNYFEYDTQPAVDAHTGVIGPFTVKGNVMYKCHGGVGLISGYAIVTDNVIVDDLYRGIALYNRYIATGMSSTIVDRVERNTLINVPRGITIQNAQNFVIQDNVARGTNAMGAIVFESSTTTPRTAIIKGNILEGYTSWISQQVENPYLQNTGNVVKSGGVWKYLQL